MDIYHRNVVKLSGPRKLELRGVIQNALEFLNAKPNRNYTLDDFQIGFTRSTSTNGFEYELYFRNGITQQCCSHIKLRKALKPDLELVEFTNAVDFDEENLNSEAAKKSINFILPLSGGEKSERAFRLFLSSFESVVIDEDSGQSTLVVVFHGTQSEFEHFNELVNEFKRRTKFEAARFVRVGGNHQNGKFSRSQAIQSGIDSLNCDPNDCLIFICDVDILFNRNFLDLCR